jgi:hydrogenase maturation factor
MAPDAGLSPHCARDEHCITCGDTAVSMRVIEVDERAGLAVCADGDGGRETVETALVGPLAPGDGVLVHAAVAIALAPEEVPA